LAGFTKRDDLAFFLSEICDAEYVHQPFLAPTQDLLDAYRKGGGSWADYEERFLDLMKHRRIEDRLERDFFKNPTALLCSEPTAEHCHRRLVAEYLQREWGSMRIRHL